MKGKQIDDLFRQKLSHQKLNPPPAAWSAIEGNLPAKKKKGAYFWMSIAASILVIFTLGWLFLDKGESQAVMEPDGLVKVETQSPVETPVEAKEPALDMVAKEEPAPEILKESPEENAMRQYVAESRETQKEMIDRTIAVEASLEDLPLRAQLPEIDMISVDERLAPEMRANPFDYTMLMPLELSAFYIPYTEDLELTPKKKKFRVLNGIISVAKEVNSGKLRFQELRNAKNNWIEDDLKYGSKEEGDPKEDDPDSLEKD